MLISMVDKSETSPTITEDGIIVRAELEHLRKAAELVLFEYDEIVEKRDGQRSSVIGTIETGDTLIFREDIDLFPAEIVAIKIWENLWYVISTSEIPPSGFPTTKDAMRAGEAEAKRLKRIKEFFEKDAGIKTEDVTEWKPDKRADADRILGLISSATKKWVH
ncbi:MAG: hypothetical protein BAJATHORv1_40209 [Candidatus Thorarchaeota archaeon]|nr:MAG: hypothetical protein BAJATHORv1_40209 [Candidatus Thorarchaeota archaeon]